MDNTKVGLGEYLRSEREKRHITIEQVASATKINIKLLHALENDNYDSLPAKPFVRGFVSSYTRYVGLDHREVLSRFEPFLTEKSGKKFDRPTDAPHIFVEKEGQIDNSKTILAVVMVGFLAIAVVVFVIIKPSLKHKKAMAKKEAISNEEMVTVVPPPTVFSATPAKTEQEPVHAAAPTASPVAQVQATPQPTPKPVAKTEPKTEAPAKIVVAAAPTPVATPTASGSPKPTPSTGPVNVKLPPIPSNEVKHMIAVRAVEDAWVKYQVDDRPVSQFTLKKDQKIYIRARQSIRFSSGRPQAIEIAFDNKEFRSFKEGPKTLIVPKDAESQFKENPFVAPNPEHLSTATH